MRVSRSNKSCIFLFKKNLRNQYAKCSVSHRLSRSHRYWCLFVRCSSAVLVRKTRQQDSGARPSLRALSLRCNLRAASYAHIDLHQLHTNTHQRWCTCRLQRKAFVTYMCAIMVGALPTGHSVFPHHNMILRGQPLRAHSPI